MDLHLLGSLLHISDPTLPIGGYTHSNGLETYVQQGIVHHPASAAAYVSQMLSANLHFNDAAFVCLAYKAVQAADFDELLRLDEELTALKLPVEIRNASQKLGLRLIKIFRRQKEFAIAADFENAILRKEASGNYAIAFGVYTSLLAIPLREALYAFYYNAAAGMVTNAVKLVPLGQLDGQDILFNMQTVIAGLIDKTITLDRDLVGVCNIGFDIRCMQHERLYSRLYMS
ncbi:urease accessory protein UreF [Chitinophaga sp. Cy-1792]|uniref:urease accessory protein UreF n=1 Tax=Chitinophaga sp. Cy-1792 TaxID=2608339 RepID=UPI00141DAA7B|nr:urease accessory protein UreF [Chitinophaga sp. Cy-1792]NIG56603.1 urease accessory protein UreF [Chitinophaga sp. Cy-1792]